MIKKNNIISVEYRYNPKNSMSVDWYIGRRCNYDCSYCSAFLHDNKSPHMNIEVMKNFVDVVYNKFEKNVLWSLTGGEPTVHPKFHELIEYIKIKKGCEHLSITTNGSIPVSKFLEYYEILDSITFSLHFEYIHDKIEEYYEKVIKLEEFRLRHNEKSNNYKNLIVRFMVLNKYFDKIMYFYDKIKGKINTIELRYIRLPAIEERTKPKQINFIQNYHKIKSRNNEIYEKIKDFEFEVKDNKEIIVTSEDYQNDQIKEDNIIYTEEQKAEINKKYNEIPEDQKKLNVFYEENGEIKKTNMHYNYFCFNRYNNFKNWLCYAGSRHIKIDPDGNIFVGSCHFGGKLGNIKNGDIRILDYPIRCKRNKCTDNLDLKILKIKDWKYSEIVERMKNECSQI
ncbi:MAG: radical SAM protein [Candidatus Dojkabacteria bacterium]|nr:radical SAM protein [Candidatus Dojkabacteria bacterium]